MREYFRKCLRKVNPYNWEPSAKAIAEKCGLPESEIFRFDQNTVSQKGISASSEVNEYPDPSYASLIDALAKYTGISKTQIGVGAGADEVIDTIVKVFVDSEDPAVISTPTYSMYRLCIEIAGGRIIEVPRGPDFAFDPAVVIEGAKQQNAKIIFVCNPNNPDGFLIPEGQIEEILKGFSGPVVVDEAYFEFCNQSVANLIERYQNLIVIRTLSKAFGLAGARVGYALSSEDVITQFNKVRLPVSISSLSEKMAVRALGNVASIRGTVGFIRSERERVKGELVKLGFKVFSSVCNFLLFKASSPGDAERLFENAQERGFVIRNLTQKAGCESCLRITIRSKEENENLLAALSACPDGIIFDIDGVLIDVSKSYRKAIIETVKTISGKEISEEEIEKIKSFPNSNNDWDVTYAIIEGITDLRGINRNCAKFQTVKQQFQKAYSTLKYLEMPLMEKKTIDALSARGYPIGIVTSRPREEALYALDMFFPGLFSGYRIIAQEDCTSEKPFPEPLLLAKKRMGCRAPLYVGDTINDSLAAKAAGMRFASVTANLESDFYLDNVNKLLEVIA